jgi:arginine N-succinyltransferase
MFVVRPGQKSDLAALKALATLTPEGLTTLPADEAYLKKKLIDSQKAFESHTRKSSGQIYLFVLEDIIARKVVGTAGIVSKVGYTAPYYSYKIQKETHTSKALNVYREIKVLHRTVRRNGPTEIGSLFLSPNYRSRGLSRLLSLSRFLYMATFPGRFDKKVISELRGAVDEEGRPPFWEDVSRVFFDTDFYTADFLSGTGKKGFIGELMPKHPIYISLLSPQAQEAIGQVHRDARPAMALLEQEGFVFNGEVDIFDAGPTLSAPLRHIRTVRSSMKAVVQSVATTLDSPAALISNMKADFRVCIGGVKANADGSVDITKETACVLELKPGEKLRYIALKAI